MTIYLAFLVYVFLLLYIWLDFEVVSRENTDTHEGYALIVLVDIRELIRRINYFNYSNVNTFDFFIFRYIPIVNSQYYHYTKDFSG